MSATNPWIGPRPFDRGEEMFGRDRETVHLRDLLVARRVVLLHAPSGAGKTSLLRAKLVPALEEEGFEVTPRLLVGAPPTGELGRATTRYGASAVAYLSPNLTPAQIARRSLTDALTRWVSARPRGDDVVLGRVIVFDQFEEILTLDPGDQTAKHAFFEEVGALLRDPHWLAIFGIREEHVGALEPFARAIPGGLDARFRLDLLSPRAALQAIREPARRAGAEFEEGAARHLVEDLRTSRVQQPDGSWVPQSGPYVDPMQLQVVCQRLWDEPRPDAARITLDDVTRLGRVDQTLAAHFDRAASAIATATRSSEKQLREWIERQLVTAQGLRGQVLKAPKDTSGLPNVVIDALVEAHLVRAERRRGADWLELAHDRLINPVLESNRAWRERNVAPLQRSARSWIEAGRSSALLATQTSLEEARRWADAHPADVGVDERAFLDASEKAAARAARRVEFGTALEELGWAVVFPASAGDHPPELDALRELLEYRRAEAGAEHAAYYREFVGEAGYRPGESAQEFLARHGAGTMRAPPATVPYYLLIVADPATIPFKFQFGLDLQYAVGRLHFDVLGDYASYARSVVRAETGGVHARRRAAVFAPVHERDMGTQVTRDKLVGPLLADLRTLEGGWSIDEFIGPNARKWQLERLLGSDPPALLFTASHTLARAPSHPARASTLGALVCADWPRPGAPLEPDMIFGASDVTYAGDLAGLIAFMFGGSTVGASERDEASAVHDNRTDLNVQPLVAPLAKRLLAHPRGGALGIIGHVDTPWLTSFLTEYDVSDTAVFAHAMRRLMLGHTIGSAMEPFSTRYAYLSAQLADHMPALLQGKISAQSMDLRRVITHVLDARNYAVVGDPAARLPLAP
jgi:hypothetical protein